MNYNLKSNHSSEKMSINYSVQEQPEQPEMIKKKKLVFKKQNFESNIAKELEQIIRSEEIEKKNYRNNFKYKRKGRYIRSHW